MAANRRLSVPLDLSTLMVIDQQLWKAPWDYAQSVYVIADSGHALESHVASVLVNRMEI